MHSSPREKHIMYIVTAKCKGALRTRFQALLGSVTVLKRTTQVTKRQMVSNLSSIFRAEKQILARGLDFLPISRSVPEIEIAAPVGNWLERIPPITPTGAAIVQRIVGSHARSRPHPSKLEPAEKKTIRQLKKDG